MDFEKLIELTFKIVVILASLGVVIALFKKVFTKIKNALLYFNNVDIRITALEKKVNRRKPKTKKKT